MSREIERKFLLEALPAFAKQLKFVDIEQGYIAIPKSGNEVRLRKANDKYTLTVKSEGSMVRNEYEIEISEVQYQTLWPSTAGARLSKRRYFYEEGGWLFEIDEYRGSLKGLLVAEVEFGEEGLAVDFEKPDWMGQEITHVNFMKNKNLLNFLTGSEVLEAIKDTKK